MCFTLPKFLVQSSPAVGRWRLSKKGNKTVVEEKWNGELDGKGRDEYQAIELAYKKVE